VNRAALIAAAACLLAPAAAGAAGGRPPAGLSASPTRLNLSGAARETVRLRNPGAAPVVVDIARAGFALDLRGRPRVLAGATGSAAWLAVRPRRLVLPPLGTGTFTVASTLPKRAEPGDHGALVLLTTRPTGMLGVAVRMRIGIVVTVRVPGTVVHRLRVEGLRVRRTGRTRLLRLVLVNRGNVTEPLRPGRIGVALYRRGRRFAALRVRPRDLLPHTRGIAELPYGGSVRGRVTARIRIDGRQRRALAIRL
jgi:hypothetical protein